MTEALKAIFRLEPTEVQKLRLPCAIRDRELNAALRAHMDVENVFPSFSERALRRVKQILGDKGLDGPDR